MIGIESTVLPLSGLHLQWRPADQSGRVLDAAQAAAEDSNSVALYDTMWWTWTGTEGSVLLADGDVWIRPSWIVCYGQMPADGTVTVTLADGQHPAVTVVGQVWAAEWSGLAQAVTVQYGNEQLATDPMRRPSYLH